MFKSRVKKKRWFSWTWRRYREGERIQAVCDYILTGKRLQWKKCSITDVNFDTDHRLLKGRLRTNNDRDQRQYKRYLRRRKAHTLDLYAKKASGGQRKVDKLLEELNSSIENAATAEKTERSWILKEAFSLIRKKTKALRQNDGEEVKQLGRELRRTI